ncbi:MAG: SH3 domain-containing protein [Acidaminococcaceae bacterium]|uniref:SH3 domain-containing protein n=1 Tax=Succiniclasticum sp. TaxID=2775030 RepID=UPI000E8A1A93|nr:SH3 domain-containing protein [Succiniclasticum sp.]MBO5590607.1 SH3 domain-containing protein [Acidaminococcaceae bacterium]MBO5638052.1 SH3 domain-containing protein [Acidaminococcaceae bacterium]MBR1495319.1 SH3 domain-containing protein [Acidaminococcaceae bacterium]MBR1662298.1 SH3 domain-containing protein [Acidaminococcaceae bacterium]MDY6290847.1 SH3 domain-containing protein [Succiniclasticum sp.]
MKKLLLLLLFVVTVLVNAVPAEALIKGEQVFIGDTYYITGRNVWIRDEPNTNIEPVAAYRFGEPVKLLEVKGDWAHVKLVNGWDRYVHIDYVGSQEIVQSKLKATSECMLELDRIYDDVERLMESMYPNDPNEKAPAPADRKNACAKLTDRLNAMRKLLEGTSMPDAARNEIRSLTAKVETLIGFLNEWDTGGLEKYTPYFLDEFMPEYDRIGDLYR